MEFFLNFAWALLAFTSLCLWFRFDRRETSERRVGFMALATLIVILFPVISVSDDLWSLQNPAETDTSLRRDHIAAAAHAVFPIAATLATAFAGPVQVDQGSTGPRFRASLPVHRPAIDRIQNRPPPSA
jgi:hypothetical protein